MNIDNLTIKEVREIAAFLNVAVHNTPIHTDRLAPDGDIVIAVLQRGHVVVGKYSQTGNIGRLDDASVIRRWGTSEGLGELAMKGPLPEESENGPTVLDKCPPVTFHVREVVMIMEVNGNAW